MVPDEHQNSEFYGEYQRVYNLLQRLLPLLIYAVDMRSHVKVLVWLVLYQSDCLYRNSKLLDYIQRDGRRPEKII